MTKNSEDSQDIPPQDQNTIPSHGLQTGDLIFFLIPDKPNIVQRAIRYGQTLYGPQEGQENLVHVAVCIGVDGQGGAQIAHVTENKKHKGYTSQPLAESFAQDGVEDRTYLIYRSTDQELQKKIGKIAAEPTFDKGKTKTKWSIPAAFHAATHRSTLTDDEFKKDKENISKQVLRAESFCSMFGVQVIKSAVRALGEGFTKYFPRVSSFSTPHTIEAAMNKLAANGCYSQHYHYSSNITPRKAVERTISEQLQRLKKLGADNHQYARKYLDCSSKYEAFLLQSAAEDAKNQNLSGAEKEVYDRKMAVALCKLMLPEFNQHTSGFVGNTKSAQALLDTASRYCIYKRDLTTETTAQLIKELNPLQASHGHASVDGSLKMVMKLTQDVEVAGATPNCVTTNNMQNRKRSHSI